MFTRVFKLNTKGRLKLKKDNL